MIKEMRLRDICSIEDANAYLGEYIEDHNRRFAVAPRDPTDAHRPLDRWHDLERILSIHEARTVSKSLSKNGGDGFSTPHDAEVATMSAGTSSARKRSTKC